MSSGRGFAREQVLEAIGGCGGIMSTVASRLGCAWDTAKGYVQKWTSTKQAFENERAAFLDACESVLVQNVKLSMEKQKQGEIVDTADPKWVLARLGKDRGYTERRQVEADITSGGQSFAAVFREVLITKPDETVEDQ